MTDINLLKETIVNGTFDLSAVENAVREIRENSFYYLYNAQKESQIYRRFDFTMSEFKQFHYDPMSKAEVTPFEKRYVLYLKESFVDSKRRFIFKRSQYYNKKIGIYDIANNPKIFNSTYMVFIDGKFFDSINIKCDEDTTMVMLDIQSPRYPTGIPQSYFDQLVAANKPVTILFVANCAYGIYNTNINALNQNRDNLALKSFNIVNSLDTDPHYITFINNNDLLFGSVITDTVNSAGMMRFTNNTQFDFAHKLVNLNVFGFRHLLSQISVDSGTKFFTVPKQEMPVPIENMMIFRNIGGKKFFAHDLTIKMYYPNYYEVLGNTTNDALTIYVFYSDDTKSSGGVAFSNELDLYLNNFPIDVSAYNNGTIPTIIRDYMPANYNYNGKNFEGSSDYPDHFKYKIDKLKEFITSNADLLRIYLRHRMDNSNAFYIDCSKINLSAKLRSNNFGEVRLESEKITFPQQRYLFVLKSYYNARTLNYRIFIDGELYYPDIMYSDGTYEYYYIPTTKISSTTLIEVEKIDTFSFNTTIKFASLTDKKEIKFNSPVTVDIGDVFIIDATTNRYINKTQSLYTISIIENGVEVDLPFPSFKKLKGGFFIRPNDATLVDVDLTVHVDEYFFFSHKLIENTDDMGDVFVFNTRGDLDGSAIRMFKNGRRIPVEYMFIRFDGRYDKENFVASRMIKAINDEFVIDYTPYKYKEIYYVPSIVDNGFLNLKGYIDKPFDLKYYDVYVNGRKLNASQIDIVTPTRIFLKNINSTMNLYILEKKRDGEYFGLGNLQSIGDGLWDSFAGLRDAYLNKYHLTNTEPDILTELVDVYSLEVMHFFRSFMWDVVKFINPDLAQITAEARDRYPYILDGKSIFMINPNDRDDVANVVMRLFPK